jgi:hypothetical protein
MGRVYCGDVATAAAAAAAVFGVEFGAASAAVSAAVDEVVVHASAASVAVVPLLAAEKAEQSYFAPDSPAALQQTDIAVAALVVAFGVAA